MADSHSPSSIDPAGSADAGSAGGPVLTCAGLTKAFEGRTVVDEVAFTIARGETYGLLGPNGAGKTTTINLICGLLRREAGTVVIDGVDLDDAPRRARAAIGYVPQDLAIYLDLTAAENLRFFGRLQGLGGRRLTARVEEVLGTVGLTDRADDKTSEFSGGMKRRLNIGIGLLHEPRLLILDEPTVGVDPQSRDSILASVDKLGAAGIGVLYTTHYMEEAERLCDRVGIIDGGRLVAEGTRAELIHLTGEHDHVRLGTDGPPEPAIGKALDDLPHVATVMTTSSGVELELTDSQHELPAILAAATEAGARVQSVELIEPDLETVFLHLTGRALRD
jgi:ABC-2 type transport system ATP-binding protein